MREFRFSIELQRSALDLLSILINNDDDIVVEAQRQGLHLLCSNLMSQANACCVHVHGEARILAECLNRRLVHAQKVAIMEQENQKRGIPAASQVYFRLIIA
jgi:hypothetical protein